MQLRREPQIRNSICIWSELLLLYAYSSWAPALGGQGPTLEIFGWALPTLNFPLWK